MPKLLGPSRFVKESAKYILCPSPSNCPVLLKVNLVPGLGFKTVVLVVVVVGSGHRFECIHHIEWSYILLIS